MQDTIDQIEIVAEKTGVNLDDIMKPAYELGAIGRKLREATKASIGDARALASAAARGTATDFDQKWAAAVQKGIEAVIGKELYNTAFEALMAREEAAEKAMGWNAMGALSAHVESLAGNLLALDLTNVRSAELAIAAGATKDYTRANEIIDQLQEIANLPDISRTALRVWVLIKPPMLPEARPDERGQKISDDHTPDEVRLINQASDIGKASDLRGQLLTAINHGWELSIATSDHEYTTRSRRWHAASHITVGGLSRAI